MRKDKDDESICIFCHTPRGSNSDYSGNFVWDSNTLITETTYVVYNDREKDENGETVNSSKACLGCHDGVNAVNSIFKLESSASKDSSIHNDLEFDKGHPISIEYDDTKASLNPLSGAIGSKTKGYQSVWTTPDGSQNIESLLKNNKIECSSCHDPHLGENSLFLRVKSNEKSSLCLGCHSK